MNELSQQAGGNNYSFASAFPKEYAAAKVSSPVVEEYRKDLQGNPLAEVPVQVDQRSQAYAQRADIAKWIEANKNAPKGADGMNIVDRFLAKQRPSSDAFLQTPETDKFVEEAWNNGGKGLPTMIKPGESLQPTGWDGGISGPQWSSEDQAFRQAAEQFGWNGAAPEIKPATAESNRQINLGTSPVPEANAAQAKEDATKEFFKRYAGNNGVKFNWL